MKANELRIGNLVSIEPVIGTQKVIGIFPEYIVTPMVEKANFELIEPIKLSKKWLLNFGFSYRKYDAPNEKMRKAFEEQNPMIKYLDIHTEFPIYPPYEKKIHWTIEVKMPHGNLYPINVIYVHQLQNIYFAITGEELTIKKEVRQ